MGSGRYLVILALGAFWVWILGRLSSSSAASSVSGG